MSTQVQVITRVKAEADFLGFVELNEELSERHGVANYFEMAHRVDTWQVWPLCDGDHTKEGLAWPCFNAGLCVTIDAPDPEPFIVTLGPWILSRHSTARDAFEMMVRHCVSVVQWSALHLHELGYPCHVECSCADEGALDEV